MPRTSTTAQRGALEARLVAVRARVRAHRARDEQIRRTVQSPGLRSGLLTCTAWVERRLDRRGARIVRQLAPRPEDESSSW